MLIARSLLAGAAVLAVAAPAQAATGSIAAKPRLTPAFDPAVRDYVSRCGTGKPLRLRVTAPREGSAAVDAGRRRHGSFRKRVNLDAGQQARIAMRSGGETTTYHVRCLPAAFPDWDAARAGPTQASHYLVTPVGPGGSRYPAIFDARGVPVWWTVAKTATFDLSLLGNGHVAWSRYYAGDQFGWRPTQAYEERTLAGRLVRTIRTKGTPTDVHDLRRLPNGHYLAITYQPREHVDLSPYDGPSDATILDCEIQELTRAGRVVWRWNSRDHISLDETRAQGPISRIELADGRVVYDPVHVNSVEPNGDELVISLRSTAAVYGIDREDGTVRWKLGGTERPESLDFAGDDLASFGGQHDARVLPDGTLTIYDNGTGRDRPPRAVRYRLDRAAGIATLLEQITDPDAPRSNYAGGARRLPGGNWAVSWANNPLVGEYTPSGERVFSLRFPEGYISYRVVPLARGTMKTSTLRRAMDRQFGTAR